MMLRPRNKSKTSQILFGFSYDIENVGRAYYFLLTSKLKKTLLQAQLRKNVPLVVSQYGEVIASGYGTLPESLKILLGDRYNVEF
jgi:hypothetical protein